MRSHFGRGLLAGAICLTTAGVSAAQTAEVPELVTDRPDFTESSEVVGHRVVQIETGLRLEQSDATTRHRQRSVYFPRINDCDAAGSLSSFS
jgi:hypothetical protein